MKFALPILLMLAASASAPAASQISFEHTPSAAPFAQGEQAYRHGRYARAMRFYKSAARWSDKIAQFQIGLMYYSGEGVEPDHPLGWAWIEMAAERGYPQYEALSERIWAQMDEDQRARASRILEQELLPEYGDEATVPRTARRMKQDRQRMTGSRLGRAGNLSVCQNFGVQTSAGAGCADAGRNRADFYREDNWDFYALIEREKEMFEQHFKASVELGELEMFEQD